MPTYMSDLYAYKNTITSSLYREMRGVLTPIKGMGIGLMWCYTR